MNTDPQQSEITEARPEAAPKRAERGLTDGLSMRGSIRIPRTMRPGITVLCVVLTLTLVLGTVLILVGGATFWVKNPPRAQETDAESTDAVYPYADGRAGNSLLSVSAESAAVPASLIGSSYAALADLTSGQIIASRLGDEIIFPASMTKVMTLIVIAERLPYESSLQDTVTVSQEVFDRMAAEGASGFGFHVGMQLTVEALLYALMLQSDGIAACELARYVAGSEAAFVELMNQKAADMGLVATHFENPTGLHHPDHRSTAREIASIMAYAMSMKLCRTVMTAESYRTSITEADGEQDTYTFYNSLLVHHFADNPEHHLSNIKIIAGKTGYTPESGYCLVTYAESTDGQAYVCVTANASKEVKYAGCIADYMALYGTYARP